MNSTNILTPRIWGGFYPGGIWMKRLRHLIVFSLIGVNIFINHLQERLLVTAEELINWSEPLTNSAVSIADYVEKKELPVLEKLEKSMFKEFVEFVGFPKASTLKAGINNVRATKKKIVNIGTDLKIFSTILFWASIIFFISISYSILWLIVDLYLGNARTIMKTMIFVAIIFNIYSYSLLNELILSLNI